MTVGKHTPGPWRTEERGGDLLLVGRPTWPCRRFEVDGEWTVAEIADVSLDGGSREELNANARLMALAPDLLAVLREVEAIAGECTSETWAAGVSEIWLKTRAALAKVDAA